MSVCPRPDVKASGVKGTLAVLTAPPPPATFEGCGSTITNTTGGGAGTTTTTTVYVQGPPGPPGPKGDKGDDGWGFVWQGEWNDAVDYLAQDVDNPLADVVSFEGNSYVCIQDHTSALDLLPSGDVGDQYWEMMAGTDGTTSMLLPDEKSFLDNLKDNVFDWMENADLTDWLLAGAAAAGIIWAGSEIIDMMLPDAETGDGNSDQRYTGTPAYSGSYTPPTVRNVVEKLCLYAGVAYDVSTLGTDQCEFTIGSNTTTQVVLEELSLAYQFDILSSFETLKITPRNVTPVATITADKLGFSSSSTPPPPYVAKRFQGIDLPNQVTLSYFSAALDYGTFTQSSSLHTYKEGTTVNLRVPVTLTDARAKLITEVAIINSHLERMNYKFNTSYEYVELEPGDIVTTPMGILRILKITETEEGILEFEASDAGQPTALEGSLVPIQPPPATTNVAASVGYSKGLFIDPPNLNDQDKTVRVYCAVHGYGVSGWPGAAIFMSEDGGSSYQQISQTSMEATVGIVAVAAPSADYHIWDNTSSISVVLKTGTLLSKSEIAVLNGANLCMIGQEIIGFKTATLTAPNTYTLTGLLRGLQGTEWAISTHTNDELFCMIDDGLVRIELNDSDRGTTKKFKIVTFGSSLDVTAAQDVLIISNNTRMWSSYGGKGVLAGQDWTITWNERVRFDNQLKDFTTANHDYDWAGAGIAILGPGDVVKRTVVNQGGSFVYTAAMQVADFGIIQNSVKASVVQMSQKWGGGFPEIINM